MKLATWNVNSVRARLERALAWTGENLPDIVCLQETKVVDSVFPASEFKKLGYEIALHGQKTYNGVAILSREALADVARGFSDGGDDNQARFLAATTFGVRVLCAYVPNGQSVGSEKFSYKLAWLGRLRAWLDAHADKSGKLALCGDFNVAPEPRDVHDPAAWEGQVLFTLEERAAIENVRAFGLVDAFRKHHAEPGFFSWWDYRQLAFPMDHGLRIDHIWVTAPLANRCAACVIDRNARKGKLPSDHAPVVATFGD